MDKSYNIKKRKYMKKKCRYSCYDDIRNICSLQKPVRTYVKSYVNKYITNIDMMENLIYPSRSNNTYTWYDGTIMKPKVYKLIN